jgi:putative flippase GtrA
MALAMRHAVAIWEFVKYFLVSAIALGVDWSLLIALTELGHLNYLASAAISYTVGLVLAYGLSVAFVFGTRRVADVRFEFVVFALIGVLGMGLTQLVLFGVVEIGGVSYALAKAPAAALVFCFNFGLRRAILFSGAGGPAISRLSLPRLATLLWPAIGAVSVVSLFALSRPYVGIVQDARIYIGRGLADLDPGGVGRDMMFANDGQSGFTVFTFAVDRLVGLLGASEAGLVLALAGMGLWLAGAAWLLSRLGHGRLLWAMLVFVAVMPLYYYVGFGTFEAGEALAVPRPAAEAAVLAGLAALVARQRGAGLVFLALAGLLHPIMALGGWCIALLLVCHEDRRWRMLAAVGLVCLPVAALLGLPLAGRLFVPIDALWRAINEARAPHVYLSHWPAGAWCVVFVQAVTVAIAARFVTGRARVLLIASILTAGLGLAMSLALGDWLGSLLVLQAQPWRMQWVLSVLAAGCLPLAIVHLWRQRPSDRLTAILIASAAVPGLPPAAAGAAAALAAMMQVVGPRLGPSITPAIVDIGLCAAALGVFLADIPFARLLTLYMASKPADVPFDYPLIAGLGLHVLPICLLAVWWALRSATPSRFTTQAAAAAAMMLALGALALWDARPAIQRAVDDGDKASPLPDLLGAKPGEVLWLGGDFITWQLAHRANWAASVQGASTIFSRPLTFAWDARISRAIALGLADPTDRARFSAPLPDGLPSLPAAPAVAQFCDNADAPAWIIAPIERGKAVPPGIRATLWPSPAPQEKLLVEGERLVWHRIAAYAVVRCAH